MCTLLILCLYFASSVLFFPCINLLPAHFRRQTLACGAKKCRSTENSNNLKVWKIVWICCGGFFLSFIRCFFSLSLCLRFGFHSTHSQPLRISAYWFSSWVRWFFNNLKQQPQRIIQWVLVWKIFRSDSFWINAELRCERSTVCVCMDWTIVIFGTVRLWCVWPQWIIIQCLWWHACMWRQLCRLSTARMPTIQRVNDCKAQPTPCVYVYSTQTLASGRQMLSYSFVCQTVKWFMEELLWISVQWIGVCAVRMTIHWNGGFTLHSIEWIVMMCVFKLNETRFQCQDHPLRRCYHSRIPCGTEMECRTGVKHIQHRVALHSHNSPVYHSWHSIK